MKNLLSSIILIALISSTTIGYSQTKRSLGLFTKKSEIEKIIIPKKSFKERIRLNLPMKKKTPALTIPSSWGTPITGNYKGSASYGLMFKGETFSGKVLFINSRDIFQKTPVGIPVVGLTATF